MSRNFIFSVPSTSNKEAAATAAIAECEGEELESAIESKRVYGRIADILYQIRRFSRESERSREKIIRRELARSCNFPAFSLFNLLRLSDLSVIMTTSRRLAERKVEKFQKNITKRGAVPETTTKKGKDYPVGPVLLGFFIFVVIGSSLFQIIRTATSGGMA
ncbi:hypothetical protein ES288_D02G183700v1 [Gossypium darwinii]|nr:hypothetical protein ES288_D02G183700v1 [Gossypium darwinii]